MNFLRISFLAVVLVSGLAAGSAWAQSAPAGPVQLPAGTVAPTPAPGNPPLAPQVSNPVSPTLSPTPAAAQQSAAPAEDIRDIHGVISIPYEWLWAAYLLGAIVLAAAIYAAWRWFRSRAKVKAKLPYEIALEKLEAARSLITTATVREYAFTVSEIIRVYIEQRFGERAARRTTEEFLSDLVKQPGTPLAQHSSALEDFLNHCDLIKFAKWGASERELESMQESARAFILDTRPQPGPRAAQTKAQPEPAVVQ